MRFPTVLGNRKLLVKKASLPQGVFYRGMIGGFAGVKEAADFCLTLKAVGGDCVIIKLNDLDGAPTAARS